jgi:Ribosomal protein S3
VGQKINPTGLRVGIIRDWEAKWYAEKDFAAYLGEDLKSVNISKNALQMPQCQQ